MRKTSRIKAFRVSLSQWVWAGMLNYLGMQTLLVDVNLPNYPSVSISVALLIMWYMRVLFSFGILQYGCWPLIYAKFWSGADSAILVHLQSKYGSCRSMMHWNPVVTPVPVNSTVTLLFLPTVSPALVLTTAQNVEASRTRILFRMTALSFLTGSTATTRSTWSPAGRPVRL